MCKCMYLVLADKKKKKKFDELEYLKIWVELPVVIFFSRRVGTPVTGKERKIVQLKGEDD